MMRSAPWLVAALCLAVGGGLLYQRTRRVDAGPLPAEEVVRRAWTQGRRVPLEGQQTVQVPSRKIQVEAKVLQSAEGNLRIEYLTGRLKGVIVWENEAQTYRFNPETKRLSVARRRGPGATASLSQEGVQLLNNYTARLDGEAPIAGRQALVVELRSRRDAAHWRRLWIDPKTWFLLASEEHQGTDKNLLRSSQFTSVHYLTPGEAPSEAQFSPPADLIRRYASARRGDTSSRFSPEQLGKLVGFPIRQPSALPAGYRLEGAYPTPCACKVPHQAARLAYTDGLTALTLFQCGHPRCPKNTKCFGGDPRDQMTAFRRHGAYFYLIVGDMPHLELERVLDSLAAQ